MFRATSCGPGALLPIFSKEHRLLSSHFWIIVILFLIPLVGVSAEKNKNCKLKDLTIKNKHINNIIACILFRSHQNIMQKSLFSVDV